MCLGSEAAGWRDFAAESSHIRIAKALARHWHLSNLFKHITQLDIVNRKGRAYRKCEIIYLFTSRLLLILTDAAAVLYLFPLSFKSCGKLVLWYINSLLSRRW